MFVKRLDKGPFFDVFLDNGWNNWTRVQRFHWGVRVVAGNRLSREAIRELNDRLVK